MAIFGGAKKKKDEQKRATSARASSVTVKADADLVARPGKSTVSVLLRPRVTEKSSVLAEKNTYVFEIRPDANKKEVVEAVKAVYNVTPRKIAIVNLPRKRVFSRGKLGMQSGVKKAFVYLKQGDKIEFV